VAASIDTQRLPAAAAPRLSGKQQKHEKEKPKEGTKSQTKLWKAN